MVRAYFRCVFESLCRGGKNVRKVRVPRREVRFRSGLFHSTTTIAAKQIRSEKKGGRKGRGVSGTPPGPSPWHRNAVELEQSPSIFGGVTTASSVLPCPGQAESFWRKRRRWTALIACELVVGKLSASQNIQKQTFTTNQPTNATLKKQASTSALIDTTPSASRR